MVAEFPAACRVYVTCCCRSFALRLRATASKLGAGRPGGRFKTDDVVKDTPLPEFKLDLSTLAAAFAPVRPLRPQRKAVKKVQVRPVVCSAAQ
jgi:hypothetical protein